MSCLRLSASRKIDQNDRDAARVEKASGHGPIELGSNPTIDNGPILNCRDVFGKVVQVVLSLIEEKPIAESLE